MMQTMRHDSQGTLVFYAKDFSEIQTASPLTWTKNEGEWPIK